MSLSKLSLEDGKMANIFLQCTLSLIANCHRLLNVNGGPDPCTCTVAWWAINEAIVGGGGTGVASRQLRIYIYAKTSGLYQDKFTLHANSASPLVGACIYMEDRHFAQKIKSTCWINIKPSLSCEYEQHKHYYAVQKQRSVVPWVKSACTTHTFLFWLEFALKNVDFLNWELH
jgi:hypothetical protein